MAPAGLSDAFDHTPMGELTERQNTRLGISRAEQDEFAARSHQRRRRDQGRDAGEMVPVPVPQRLAVDIRASSGSGRRRWWRRPAAGLLVVADGLAGGGRRLRGQQAGGQPRMTGGRTDRRATLTPA